MACTEIEYDAGNGNQFSRCPGRDRFRSATSQSGGSPPAEYIGHATGVQIIVKRYCREASLSVVWRLNDHPCREWPSGMYTIQAMTGHNNKTVIGKLLVQH